MEKTYKVSEVARMLNVSAVAVRKWIRAGKLNAKRVGKLWMIPESELKRFLGEKPSEIRAVIYARVSPHKQKKDGNLDRQVERLRAYCSARGYRVVDMITDTASGLNEDRKGLLKLFDIVEKRQADIVVVEFRDRLTRFGFNYLKRYFESHGVKIEVVEESEKGYGGAYRGFCVNSHKLCRQNLWKEITEVQGDKKDRRGDKRCQLKLSRRQLS